MPDYSMADKIAFDESEADRPPASGEPHNNYSCWCGNFHLPPASGEPHATGCLGKCSTTPCGWLPPASGEPSRFPCCPHNDLYDPAQHTEDGHGGCVICTFYVPHTDEEHERVAWPCAVVREARATPPSLDVDRLRQDLREALQYAGSSRLASDKIRSVLARLADQEPK